MHIKKLPVAKPSSYGYQFYSYPLAILENYEATKPWVYTNYIQLAFDRDFQVSPVPFCYYFFDYAINPWLHVHRLSREIIAMTHTSIRDFLMECLDHDYYIYLNLDEYYVPNRMNYKFKHLTHDLMAYGYDSLQKEFEILGYDRRQSYGPTRLSFDQFEEAYRSLDEIPNDCTQIYLYKYKPEADYTLNVEQLIGMLEDYLYGRNTSERFGMLTQPWDRAYGTECYVYLRQYLEMFVNQKTHYDIRHFHILWEHKHMMVLRVEYLESLGLLSDLSADDLGQFREIEKKSLTLRNLHMKFSMDFNMELGARLLRLLDEIEQGERIALERLITGLRRQSDAINAVAL